MAQATVKLRKRRAQAARAADRKGKPASAERSWLQLTGWQWSCIALLAAAAVLRLFSLSAKVLHHDEGVNGLFMTSLFRQGYYHYDPANYHGPTLYYAGLVTTTVNALFYGKAGLSTFAIRLVTAIFGVGVVWLVLCLRRQLGTFGAIAAAAMAATSAGMVFFSRYFIHEILFVFFSLGVVVAWLRFKETAEPKYLMLASSSLALLGATKETWIITVAVWLLALLCAAIYMRLRTRPGEEDTRRKQAAAARREPSQKPEWSPARLWTTAALVFVAIWVLFYSSFFTNFPQGLYDSVRTYGYWFKTGRTDDLHDYFTYFQWLRQAELPALALGFVGVIAALAQARSRFAVFTAFWSMGILAAYSLVPYKTPWLQLSVVLPLILMAGYGLGQMYERRQTAGAIAVLVTVVAVAASAYQAIEISFFRYDDESAAYSYAHSKRDLLNLVNEVDMIAAGNAAGKNIGIAVVSPEHWPLPWYLRDYTSAGYFGSVANWKQMEPTLSGPVVIAHENQQAEVQQLLGNKYLLYSVHDLRPGNRLFLYLRRDVQP